MTQQRTGISQAQRGRRRPSAPSDLDDLSEGDVLYDRHRRDCYLVTGIDERAVALRQRNTEFYVPRSLFVPWYGSRLFPIEHATGLEAPEWCRRSNSPCGKTRRSNE